MKLDKFGQMIYTPDEVFEISMHSPEPYRGAEYRPGPFLVNDPSINVAATNAIAGYEALVQYVSLDELAVSEFDAQNQTEWWMPADYRGMDIAAHVLSLCKSDAELQRCGEELILYMDHGLFDLLRYVKYLVDVMELNGVIWGVGRGSSVSSYILYLLKLHRVDSLFYQLDIREFLR
jgi:DNA polymerase III alpha subunit